MITNRAENLFSCGQPVRRTENIVGLALSLQVKSVASSCTTIGANKKERRRTTNMSNRSKRMVEIRSNAYPILS